MGNQDIEIFIENICNQISSEQVAKEVYQEMKDHIETMVEEFTADGLSEEKAMEQSLYNMGNPRKIGVGINRSHKKKVDMLGLSVIGSVFILLIIEILNMFNTQVDIFDSVLNKIYLISIILVVVIAVSKLIKRRNLCEKNEEDPLLIIREVKKASSMDQIIYAVAIIPLVAAIFSLIVMLFDSEQFINLESIRYPYYMYVCLIALYYSTQKPSALYQSGIATPTEFLSWDKMDSYTFVESRTKKGIVHELSVNYNKSFKRHLVKVPEEQFKAVSEIVRYKTQKY